MTKRYRCTLFSCWHGPEIHEGFESEKEAEAFGKHAKNTSQYQYEVEEYEVRFVASAQCTRYMCRLEKKVNIPQGTECVPATNIPGSGYWVEPWKGMTDEEESWMRTYGFHLDDYDVIELEVKKEE